MHIKTLIALVTLAAWSSVAGAKLPPPTPAEAQAQAAKKAAADARAEKDKQLLLAKYDELTARWRARASASSLKVNPPTPLAAPAAALTAPATQSAPSGQPEGKLTARGGADDERNPIRRAEQHQGATPPASTVKTK
jgi:colicin import membrane protein